MKYKELITRTESEINKELLDLEVEKAANVLQQGTLSVKSKVLAAEGDVKQAEIAVSVAKQELEDSKALKPFNVQNILNKRMDCSKDNTKSITVCKWPLTPILFCVVRLKS